MKGYEISGSKGTYLELEDGRFADTVYDRGDDLEALRAEVTEAVSEPFSAGWTEQELRDYVGA